MTFIAIILSLIVFAVNAECTLNRETLLYKNRNAPIAARLEDLLKRMALKEKIEQLENRATGKTDEIERIFKGESFDCTRAGTAAFLSL